MSVILFFALLALSSGGLIDDNHPFFEKPAEGGKHWALIVAGSNGYFNYRHQADVCHAYQILHKHGIPDEQIVVMMYDDIAQNPQNPTKGIIINQPNGSDVYHGVLKDYTKKTVTPKNFLNILQGNSAAMKGIGSGKVIKSGPNDHVFVNLVDHGAPGIFAFPEGELTVKQLNNAIKSMYKDKKYAKMVFYMEACESGSMFDKVLADNINVYATTAANPDESSYACYYDAKRKTYLGDVYSVMWMQDSDKEDIDKETLKQQFEITKKKTNTSHVMEYGDLTMGGTDFVGQYQGNESAHMFWTGPLSPIMDATDAVPSEDVELAILQHQLRDATSEGDVMPLQHKIRELVERRFQIKGIFHSIARMAATSDEQVDRVLTEHMPLNDYECYNLAYQKMKWACASRYFRLPQNDFALRQLYTLVNLCEEKLPVSNILFAIDTVCLPK